MKLTWHIVMKDGYRLRWRLVLWVAVLAAKTAFGFLLISGVNPGPLVKYAFGINWALIGLDVALCYLLAVMLVQEDLLVSTRAFLLTRPVSGGRLLAAKALAMGLLFGVVPALIWLPWWLHCGYGGHELMWAIAETWFWQAVVVLPAVLIATVTDSLGRVLLWSLVVVAGTPIALMMLGTWTTSAGPNIAVQMTGVVLIGVVVAVIQQYFLRQTGRSFAWLVATMGLALLAVRLWPRDHTSQPAGVTPRKENTALAKGVTMEFANAWAQEIGGRKGLNPWQGLNTTWGLHGLPDDLMVSKGVVEQRWHWADGPIFTMSGSATTWIQPRFAKKIFQFAEREPDAETERHYTEIQSKRKSRLPEVPKPSADAISVQAFGLAARSLVMRLGRESATCVAEGHFTLARPEIWYDEPIVASKWRAHAGFGLRVGRAAWEGQARFIEVCTRAAVGEDALPLAVGSPGKVREVNNFAYDAPWERVINREKGGIISPLRSELCDPVRVGTVVIRWRTLRVESPRVWRENDWVARDKDWFTAARYVVISAEEIGEFACVAKTDRFIVALPDALK